jgi:exopolysaccharide production protein ExoZ
MKKILPVQYLRGLAAVMVVAFHAPMPLEDIRNFLDAGAYGVDLFFVISGFIMTITAGASSVARLDFIAKRLLRIVPLYWLMTMSMVVLVIAAPGVFHSTRASFSTVVQSLLFIPHYSLSHPGVIYPIMVPGWTLNYEMFFYILFSMVLPFRASFRLGAIAAFFVVLVTLGAVFPGDSAVYRTYTNPILFEFVLGMGVAELYKRDLLPNLVFGIFLAVTGYAALLFTDESIRFVSKGVPATAIVLGGIVALRSVRSKVLELIGNASYSIYLTHFFAFGVIAVIGNRFGGYTGSTIFAVVYFFVAVLASMLAGVAVYKLIELPLTERVRSCFYSVERPDVDSVHSMGSASE